MTYSPNYYQNYYQPSVLELARQGHFQAIAYWINSFLGPQGIYVETETARSGSLQITVNFRTRNPNACISARQRLVRHICYRLWTLNSTAIREVRIAGRIAGQRDILWRQTVNISTPANARLRRPSSNRQSRSPAQQRFQLLRSLLLNRMALVGFIFCYWVLYLETTGHQVNAQSSTAATSTQIQTPDSSFVPPPKQAAEKTAIAPAPQPTSQNLTFTIPQQFQGQVIYEAAPPAGAEKVVALTFDDGPWTTTTEQILDILRKNSIKATFFWVGQAIQENPDIAKKVVADGHVIGNHTWQHLMTDMDEATAAQELGNNARLIYQATGVRTYLMRPPGGNLTGSLADYAKKKGYMVTMWSADSSDYYVSTPLIIDNVLSQTKPGGIVLMHDGGGDRSATVEALPQIISSLQRQGYKFVTVPEMMQLQQRWAAMPTTSAQTPDSSAAQTTNPAPPASADLTAPPAPSVPQSAPLAPAPQTDLPVALPPQPIPDPPAPSTAQPLLSPMVPGNAAQPTLPTRDW